MIGDGSERAEQSRLERRRLAMSPNAKQARPKSQNLLGTEIVPDAGNDAENPREILQADVRR